VSSEPTLSTFGTTIARRLINLGFGLSRESNSANARTPWLEDQGVRDLALWRWRDPSLTRSSERVAFPDSHGRMHMAEAPDEKHVGGLSHVQWRYLPLTQTLRGLLIYALMRQGPVQALARR
jgi:hypothetical protein